MNDTATRTGAAPSQQSVKDPDVNPSQEVEVQMSPRDIALAAMSDRQEEMRHEEIQEAVSNDPGLAASQAAIDAEIAESNAEAGIVHKDTTPSFGSNGSEEGLASKQPMHAEQPTPSALPGNLQDDPMADFIEMHNGAPMVKAKVNGQDRLIPLADAKRQVQIGVAAEVRMQNAAQAEKHVQEREARLTAGEAALQARMTTQPQQAAIPSDLSDDDLLSEATEIFNTAFSGTEEDAARKLAKTLGKIRNSAAKQPTQQIDPNAIANQVQSLIEGRLSEKSRNQDVQTGFANFKTNYPDILGDPMLFRMADDMTETIEQENPNWTIAQVMDEAGQRTRAWVKGLRGEQVDTGGTSAPRPENQNSLVSESTTQTRQDRKAGLIRMPTPAAGAQFHEPVDTGDEVQTPSDAFMELKKARGQAL
jgi:hypothetical protein